MDQLKEKLSDKIKGCIFSQAIGDALGLGTEFMSAEDVKKHYPNGLSDYSQIIQDKHRRRFVRGRWTDDTDMMLCVLYGLENSSEINVGAVAANFKKWADGVPMGIGRHTYEVLSFWDYLQNPFKAAEIIWELSGRESAANGGIMRTSAVGLLKDNVREYAEKVCKLTHPDPRCIKSCILISELISSLIWKDTELEYDDMVSMAENDAEFISYLLKAKECADISQLDLDDPKSMGYTYKTISAALWALWHCSSFEEGLLTVVNAGGDADTNAAVACSVLGAKYGFSAIPKKYVQGLYASDLLDKISDMVTNRLLAYEGRLNIVVLTGAGISAESGLPTFRGNNGLWRSEDCESMATASAFYENTKAVLDFYNDRRKQLAIAEPNKAHLLLTGLEKRHCVTVITQNVDNLHERAGSRNVIHLHGELTKVTSSINRLNPDCIKEYPLQKPILIGDKAEDGSQLRPYVVWFDEYVNSADLEKAISYIKEADIFIVIGTSLTVQPAKNLVKYAHREVPKYIIDPNEGYVPEGFVGIHKTATEGMEELMKIL